MDGRNRLEAIRRLGHKSPLEVNTRGVRFHKAIKQERNKWVIDCDPVVFILSKNVFRRHLTPEQRHDAIAAFIKADPKASNLKVAKSLKVSPHTVAKAREESAQNLQNAKSEHSPIERARAVVRENPNATVSEIVRSANVGRATAAKAKKDVANGVETKLPKPKPEPKNDERFRAEVRKTFDVWVARWSEALGDDAFEDVVHNEWTKTINSVRYPY